MPFAFQPNSGVKHRLVFELRFENGELYWDHCGRIARKLTKKEGWAIHSIDTNGCHIQKEDQNLSFSYSPKNLSLTQTQNQDVVELLPASEFASIAEEFSEFVSGSLELEFAPRMGFRLWTLYPTESLDDASSRVSKMALFKSCDTLNNLGQISYISHSVVIERPNCMIRTAVAPFEQQVNLAPSIINAARTRAREHWKDQKNILIQKLKAEKKVKSFPPLGIMMDMDAYIEDFSIQK
ncbi:MAG: hypothetical protein ACWGMZ_10110, partial [Thermoguttaceae bacterium]